MVDWRKGDGTFIIGGEDMHAECSDDDVAAYLLAAVKLAERYRSATIEMLGDPFEPYMDGDQELNEFDAARSRLEGE